MDKKNQVYTWHPVQRPTHLLSSASTFDQPWQPRDLPIFSGPLPHSANTDSPETHPPSLVSFHVRSTLRAQRPAHLLCSASMFGQPWQPRDPPTFSGQLPCSVNPDSPETCPPSLPSFQVRSTLTAQWPSYLLWQASMFGQPWQPRDPPTFSVQLPCSVNPDSPETHPPSLVSFHVRSTLTAQRPGHLLCSAFTFDQPWQLSDPPTFFGQLPCSANPDSPETHPPSLVSFHVRSTLTAQRPTHLLCSASVFSQPWQPSNLLIVLGQHSA